MRAAERRAGTFPQLPIAIRVELGTMTAPERDWEHFHVGLRFALPIDPQGLVIYAADHPVGRGVIRRVDNRLAVELAQWGAAEPEEEDSHDPDASR